LRIEEVLETTAFAKACSFCEPIEVKSTKLRAVAKEFILNPSAPAFVFSPSVPVTKLSPKAEPFTPKKTVPETKELSPAAKPFTPVTHTFTSPSSLLSPKATCFVPFDSVLSVTADEFVPASFQSSKPDLIDSIGITEGIELKSLLSPIINLEDDHTEPEEGMEKVCDLVEKKYSMGWLLSVRLEDKMVGPKPEDVPSDLTYPFHNCKRLFQSKRYNLVNPYSHVENDEETNLIDLAHLVQPSFAYDYNDQCLGLDEVCDVQKRVYGMGFLWGLKDFHPDIHPDLLHLPELLASETKQNVVNQFISQLAATGSMGGIAPFVLPPQFPGMPSMPHPAMQIPAPPLPPALMPPIIPPMMGMMPGMPGLPIPPTPMQMSELIQTLHQHMSPHYPSSFRDSFNYSPRESDDRPKLIREKKKRACSPKSRAESSSKPLADVINLPKKSAWVRSPVVTEEKVLAARTTQSILNKLTPEKFNRLLNKTLNDLHVTKLETLDEVATRVHKKAIQEAHYAPMYTRYIHKLHLAKFASIDTKDGPVDLESQLLQLSLKRIDAEIPEFDSEEKEEKEGLFRKGSLGNYVLLGELYKFDILSHDKMASLIRTIVASVANKDEEALLRGQSVESLFELLKSCGNEFEEKCRRANTDPLKPHFLEQCFSEIQSCSKEGLKSRIGFKLQDLIDLKNKHWEARVKNVLDPKFLSELEAELKKEKMRKNRMYRQMRAPKRKGVRKVLPERKRKKHLFRQTSNFSVQDSRSQHASQEPSEPKSASDGQICIKESARKRNFKIDSLSFAKIVQGIEEQNKTPKVENAWSRGRPRIPSDRSERSTSPETQASTIDTTDRSTIYSEPCENISSIGLSASTDDVESLDDHLFEQGLCEYFDSNKDDKNLLNLMKEAFEQGLCEERAITSALRITIDRPEKDQLKLEEAFHKEDFIKVFHKEAFHKGLSASIPFLDDWAIDVPKIAEIFQRWLKVWLKVGLVTNEELRSMKSETSSETWEKITDLLSFVSEPVVLQGVESKC